MSLRVGFLGPGNIAARHAAAAQQLKLSMVACCGRDAAHTEALAAQFGLKPFTDFERLLGETRLDLLIVALPPYAHTGQVEAAAAAGVNLLVEKPIALDLGRARDMVDAAGERHCRLRLHVSLRRCGRALGKPHGARLYRAGRTFLRFVPLQCSSRAMVARSAKSGGQMVEQLIHIADLARVNLGMPQTVYARAANVFHNDMADYTADDASAMLLGYDDGRVGVLHASNGAIPGRWMKGWQVVARRATGLFADWNNAEIVRTAPEVVTETVAGTADPFVAQLADVVDAIVRKRPPRVPLQDGYDTLRIVLAARRSANERREITL